MKKYLSWPNWLTISRILLIPIFTILLIYGYQGWAFSLFCLAGATDVLDGFIARSLNQRTELGTFLDPMADKLLLTTSYILLVVLKRLPIWLAVVVISRDLIIVLGSAIIYVINGHLKITPTLWGKLATFAQLLLVFTCLISGLWESMPQMIIPFLIWLTAGVTIISGLHYIYVGNSLINSAKANSSDADNS